MRCIVVLALAVAASACGRQAQVGSAPAPSSPPSPPSPPSPAPRVSRADVVTNVDQLLAAMHARYAGKWYRNLTFIQTSTSHRTDGSVSRVETWYEAMAVPGRLRIDLGDPARGNGVVYRNDSVYSVQGGRVTDRRPGRNVLMVLGFDVYAQPPARTLAQLRDEHIDVAALRTDSLNGKPVYVVGAGQADSTSNQFWVDAEQLLFVRLIQSDTSRRRTQDIRFEKYRPHGGGWVAEEVRILVGGNMIFHEEYSNVRVNVMLDDDVFVPEKWATVTHWMKP